MHWRWPWQTREDGLIKALDAALAEAQRIREHGARQTETVKKEAVRRMEASDAE